MIRIVNFFIVLIIEKKQFSCIEHGDGSYGDVLVTYDKRLMSSKWKNTFTVIMGVMIQSGHQFAHVTTNRDMCTTITWSNNYCHWSGMNNIIYLEIRIMGFLMGHGKPYNPSCWMIEVILGQTYLSISKYRRTESWFLQAIGFHLRVLWDCSRHLAGP